MESQFQKAFERKASEKFSIVNMSENFSGFYLLADKAAKNYEMIS